MDPRTLIDEGYQLYIQNNSEGALKKYNEALNLALDLAGDFPEALSEALPEAFPEALHQRSLVYQQLRENDKTTKDFSRALRALKDIMQEKPFEQALEKYNEALNLALDLAGDFPEVLTEAFPEALYHRGLVYQQLRKEDEAKEDFSRSLRFLKDIVQENPTDFNSKNYLGLVYLKLNELEKAKEAFKKIIDTASEDSLECANAFKGIGNYYYERQNYKEALNAYIEALRIYRNYVEIDINKGVSETINKVSKNSLECANAFKGIGNCYYWLKNYKETLTAYEEALIIYPSYVDIHFNKGVVFATQGKYKKSIECYKRALDIAPDYYRAYNNKSYALYETESYEEALQACKQCLTIYDDYDNALSIQGIILLRLGRYKEALEVLDKAVGLYPDFDEAWYNKGSVHFFLEQFDKAQEAFDKVIKINKKFVVQSLGYEGVIFAKLNEYDKAMESFSEGEKVVNNDISKEDNDEKYQKYLVPLMLRKSFAFYLFDKYQEALEELNSIDETSIINTTYILTLLKLKGIVYEKLRNYNEIDKNFDETLFYLEIIQETEEIYRAKFYCEMGIIHRRRGNFKDCEKAFNDAINENSAHFNSMNELGIAFRKSRELYKALKAFENALKRNPNSFEAWINKALVLRGLLKYDDSEYSFKKAMRILEAAIKLNNNYSVAYYHMGLIHYDCQEYEKASVCFERATSSKECYEDAEINKGLSLFSLERYNEAIYVFDQIINKENNINKTNNNNEAKVASLNNKGIVLLCQGKDELAYELFKEAAEIDERDADSKNNMGLVKYYQKEFKSALKLFDEAINLGGKYQRSGDACNNKGILLFKMGEVEKSKKAFDESISISPEYSSVRKNKGLILCKLGEHEEALKVFREASNIRPEEGEIHVLLAGSLLKLGDVQSADEEIEKAFKDPMISLHEKSNAYNIKGQIKIENLDYDAAINSFEKAICFNPSNLSLLIWDAYAKYLKAEFLINQDQNQNQNQNQSEKPNSKKTNPINKRYHEGIVSIIRDLEKISIEFDKKQKSINLSLYYLLKRQTLVKKLERLSLFIYGEDESKGPKKIKRFIKNNKDNINLSIMEHEYEKITEERMIEAYIFYFTGYLYYKINDLYSALGRLKKCESMKSGPNIDEPAKSLIQDIWDYQIRPPFWRWWLYSPINKLEKRTLFGIISISVLGVLFPSLFLSLGMLDK